MIFKRLIKSTIKKNFLLQLRQISNYFTGNFITSNVIASEKEYLSLHEEYVKKIKKNDFVNKNFLLDEIEFVNNLALITQVTKKKSEINYMHGFILMKILKDYLQQHKDNISIFETGTARGFSSICMSYVLKKNSYNFKITTVDLIPHNKKIYWNCISDVWYGKISRKQLLEKFSDYVYNIDFINGITEKILKKIHINRINFAFLDGSHDYDDVKLEFDFVDKRNKEGDIIILDDYTPGIYDGIVKLAREIKESKRYKIKEINENKKRGYVILKKN